MDLKQHISELAQGFLPENSYYLVEVIIKGSEAKQKVLVLIDGDDGVNIEVCASISRQIGHNLEENETIDKAYTLEVSSPGVDHPLLLTRQYSGRIGKRLKITLKSGEEVLGKLLEVFGEHIKVLKETKRGKKTETEEIELTFNDIEKSFVLISFK
ncbi:Bacterial ribosome SSU maturation protein RimP [hydrothermal vent metagenome]|uniref:Bacterial ribosome SSU maturation protein RimP n=1 Tax=hydrothermal vent metagenome TaxID=652676 RepID=A0A3B0UHL4_9ZZZZ